MSEEFWENRWKENKIGWDLGTISPPLKKYVDQLANKNIRILIPGCGNAYEAEYLFRNGFTNVFIIEISKSAIDSFKLRCPDFPNKRIIHSDFFDLEDKFDLVIEQTFFCAITPDLRIDYVRQMTNILKLKGKLVGLLFNADFASGPPFGGGKEEYWGLFSTHFDVYMETCYNSIKPRQEKELFIILRKR